MIPRFALVLLVADGRGSQLYHLADSWPACDGEKWSFWTHFGARRCSSGEILGRSAMRPGLSCRPLYY